MEVNTDLFKRLSERFSLIRLHGKDPSAAEGKGWQQWCTTRRPFDEIGFRPGENAGVACGPASGVIVLDVDDAERFADLCRTNNWTVPETFTVETGSGNLHHYYRYPTNGHRYGCVSRKPDGFDVKGLGGAVVAPGSVHPATGLPYEIERDLPIADAPAWMLELTIHDQEPETGDEIDLDALPVSDRIRKLITDPPDKGARSEALMSVVNALVAADVDSDTIYRIFETQPIGAKYREKGSGRKAWLRSHIKKAKAYVKPGKPGPKPEPVGITAAELMEKDFPDPKWIIRDLVPEGVTVFAGRPKLGKSCLTLNVALAIGFGGKALGNIDVEPGTVLYIGLEDSQRRLKARLREMLTEGRAQAPLIFGGGKMDRKKLQELAQRREKLLGEMRGMLDAATAAGRDFNADEERRYDGLSLQVRELDLQIAELRSNEPVNPPIVPQTGGRGGDRRASLLDMGLVNARWRDLFPKTDQPADYANMDAKRFFSAVAARMQPEETRGLLEGVGTSGGFAVPDTLAQQIFDSGVEASQFLRSCRFYPVAQGGDLTIPTWDSQDRTQGPIGSITATWHGEQQSAPEVSPKFRSLVIYCNKIGIYTSASREILQDGYGIERQLGNMLKVNLAWNVEKAILTANGVAKPYGIVTHPATVVVNRTSAGDIQYGDIINMFARLDPMFHEGAVWLSSPPAYAELLGMVDGASRYVFPPAGYVSAAEAPATTLLGKKIIITDKLENMGTRGDLLLCNFGAYGVIVRQDMVIERSEAVHWTTDEIAFRIVMRIGGRPLFSAPTTPPYAGGASVSPFVVLN